MLWQAAKPSPDKRPFSILHSAMNCIQRTPDTGASAVYDSVSGEKVIILFESANQSITFSSEFASHSITLQLPWPVDPSRSINLRDLSLLMCFCTAVTEIFTFLAMSPLVI